MGILSQEELEAHYPGILTLRNRHDVLVAVEDDVCRDKTPRRKLPVGQRRELDGAGFLVNRHAALVLDEAVCH